MVSARPMRRPAAWTLAASLLVWAVSLAPVSAQQKFISIGTGNVTGVYYPAGGAVCRQVNEGRKQHGFRCWVESTNGSIDNIEAVRSGDLDFGIVQSDWQFHAYGGTSRFADRPPFAELRSVFSLHAEAVTIVARNDAAISSLADLKGKRVNIGSVGSGARATWDELEQVLPWGRSDLAQAGERDAVDTGEALCAGEIDAYFWIAGHPSALVQETLTSCPSHLVEVTGAAVDSLVGKYPFYRRTEIPAGLYPGQGAVRSFGVTATVVTSERVAADEVYVVARAILGELQAFKMLHPAFAELDATAMISQGLTAPLHEGAKRAYRELGLMD